mgnify:FL=1
MAREVEKTLCSPTKVIASWPHAQWLTWLRKGVMILFSKILGMGATHGVQRSNNA